MTIEITAQEKIDIIRQHQKNLAYNQYNLQINLIEEDARVTPNADVISGYNSQIAEITRQISALDTEIASLTTAPATPA